MELRDTEITWSSKYYHLALLGILIKDRNDTMEITKIYCPYKLWEVSLAKATEISMDVKIFNPW